MSIYTTTQSQLPSLYSAYAEIGVSLMVWGSPGIGKSQSVAAYAASIGGQMLDVRLSSYDSVDIRGLPDTSSGYTVWCPASTLPIVGNDAFPDDIPLVLFLDELMLAKKEVFPVALQIILDRTVGEHKLKDNVQIIAASNRETDRTGVAKMPTALANRFGHVEVVSDLEAWKKWAFNAGIHPAIVGYLNARPQNLDQFEAAALNGAKAFATPRMWEFVNRALSHGGTKDPALTEVVLYTLLGEGVGAEFVGFLRTADRLPTLEQIVRDPEGAKVPQETDALYACASMLSSRITAKQVDAVVRYIQRLPLEYQSMWLADVSATRPEFFVATPRLVLLAQELEKAMR